MRNADPHELMEYMLERMDKARSELEDLRLMANQRGFDQDRLRADEVGMHVRPAQSSFSDAGTAFAHLRHSNVITLDEELRDISAPLGSDIVVEQQDDGTVEVTNRDFYNEDESMTLSHENAVALAMGLLEATRPQHAESTVHES